MTAADSPSWEEVFVQCYYFCPLPWWLSGKEPSCQCRRHRRRKFDPWVGKIPCRKKWQPTPVFLPGESHAQRNLMDYSPYGGKVLNTTERTHPHYFLKCRTGNTKFPFVETPVFVKFKECSLGEGVCPGWGESQSGS